MTTAPISLGHLTPSPLICNDQRPQLRRLILKHHSKIFYPLTTRDGATIKD